MLFNGFCSASYREVPSAIALLCEQKNTRLSYGFESRSNGVCLHAFSASMSPKSVSGKWPPG